MIWVRILASGFIDFLIVRLLRSQNNLPTIRNLRLHLRASSFQEVQTTIDNIFLNTFYLLMGTVFHFS